MRYFFYRGTDESLLLCVLVGRKRDEDYRRIRMSERKCVCVCVSDCKVMCNYLMVVVVVVVILRTMLIVGRRRKKNLYDPPCP